MGGRRPSTATSTHSLVSSLRLLHGAFDGHAACRRVSGRSLATTLITPLRCATRAYSKDESPFPFAPDDKDKPYTVGRKLEEQHPIVQLPARSLWCRQYALNPEAVARGEFDDMIQRVEAARHHYRYPSLCAPQIGWNVQVFVLSDGTVFVNPENLDALAWKAEAEKRGLSETAYEETKMAELRRRGQTGFAWEPCASSCFLMHYIERPLTVRVRALNRRGEVVEERLEGMRARMALHELDHLGGVLFTRRTVDANHVVPLEGFSSMSDWSDDYPSLEARSTNLYTVFTPPYTFVGEGLPDANLLERKFEDGIYPGCEHDRQMRIEGAAYEEIQRNKFRQSQEASGGDAAGHAPAEADVADDEDENDSTAGTQSAA